MQTASAVCSESARFSWSLAVVGFDFPRGIATLGVVSSLARTLQNTHLSDKNMIRAVRGARKIVGPAPNLSPVMSVYHPSGYESD